jgi:zinc protease
MKKHFLTLALLFAGAMSVFAANPIPTDPAVRIGTLDNGLTYYIRQNNTPSNSADFFIAQRVGSVNEEENQRGLAHFLEHMCFNGTAHFPGNTLISYLESIGVKFGRNLNAYTSTDETVYNICEVPTARTSALDSCLLILRDWSHDLTLNGSDIDNERGVIEGEWRQRNGAPNNRLLEKTAPIIYNGNIYGNRLPIGLMSVVKNFKHKDLRNYYHKWYHPENQCLIVVGDIDPDYIEGKIKAMFADIKRPKKSATPPRYTVDDNSTIISTVQTDKEQPYTMVQLFIKHADLPENQVNTIDEIRHDYISDLAMTILAERFDEIENEVDAPFSNLGIGDMKFLISNTCKALVVRAQAKPGRALDCMKAYATELKRAATYGITDTELQRAKLSAKAKLDANFANREKTTNTAYARKYVRHYLDGGALPSDEAYYKMMKGVASTVKADEVTAYIRSIVTDDNHNVITISYAPEDKVDADLNEQSLANAYASVQGSDLTAWVDNIVNGNIVDNLPAPGSIVAEKTISQFDTKEWTLSNGIKVMVKKTDYAPNQVLIGSYSPGGFSQTYNPEQKANYKVANDVLAVSGYGKYSSSDLRKLLVGKNVRSSVQIDNMYESVEANTTPDDLETAFQLVYLKATDARRDDAAFANFMQNTRMRIENRTTNATVAMGDSIHANVYGHHPFGSKLYAADIDNINYDTILAMHRERFSDMSDFTFFVIGNFDEDSLRTYVQKYIATLPAAGRMEHPKDAGYRYGKGFVDRKFFMPMETPQTIDYAFYSGNCDYTVQNVVFASAFGQILSSKLYQDVREARGWTYGIKTHCSVSAGMNGDDPAVFILPVYIRVAPENADETQQIVDDTFNAMCHTDGFITDDEVLKVKQYMLKNYASNANDNTYWYTVLKAYARFGSDMHTDFAKAVNLLTPQSIEQFAQKNLVPTSRIRLQMCPQ